MAKEAGQYYFEIQDNAFVFRENLVGGKLNATCEGITRNESLFVRVLDEAIGPLSVCLEFEGRKMTDAVEDIKNKFSVFFGEVLTSEESEWLEDLFGRTRIFLYSQTKSQQGKNKYMKLLLKDRNRSHITGFTLTTDCEETFVFINWVYLEEALQKLESSTMFIRLEDRSITGNEENHLREHFIHRVFLGVLSHEFMHNLLYRTRKTNRRHGEGKIDDYSVKLISGDKVDAEELKAFLR